jgi:hypothetical protein
MNTLVDSVDVVVAKYAGVKESGEKLDVILTLSISWLVFLCCTSMIENDT